MVTRILYIFNFLFGVFLYVQLSAENQNTMFSQNVISIKMGKNFDWTDVMISLTECAS